ncbi:MAG: hypothetical protein J6X55_13645 [Victivallales bacterium]|nr:hypothetical protein [Victivallales bacterium]
MTNTAIGFTICIQCGSPEYVKHHRVAVDFVVESSAFAKGYGGTGSYVVYAPSTLLEIASPFGTSRIQGNVFRIMRKSNLDSGGKTYECTRTGEMGD